MSETEKTAPPDWLPAEIIADLKAKHGGERLVPVKTELGAVVLKVPSREAILARFPAPPGNAEVRGQIGTDDGDFDKDAALCVASCVYPDEGTIKKYIAGYPGLVPVLSAQVKVSAAGIKAELKGIPDDLAVKNLAILEATGARLYQIVTDVKDTHGHEKRLILKAPGADSIRQWEASRQRQSPVTTAEAFVISCLVHPTREAVIELFQRRPLLGVYCANRLFAWGTGAIEVYLGEL